MGSALRRQLEFESHVGAVASAARTLSTRAGRLDPKLHARRVDALRRTKPLPALPEVAPSKVSSETWRHLEHARERVADVAASTLYALRLDELELELRMLESLGRREAMTPLAAERFARAKDAAEMVERLLRQPAPNAHEDVELGPEEVASLFRRLAGAARVPIHVKFEPAMTALAAAGERTVFLSPRPMVAREAMRIAVHEILGHLVSAANARAHRIALLRVGTAQSLADQEGLALELETAAHLITHARVRRVAARAWVTERFHEGVEEHEVARALVDDHAFDAEEAVRLTTRTFRAGGYARDGIYLCGWLRVRRLEALDDLRLGRISVDALPALGALREEGWVSAATYAPSLSRSLAATGFGTSSCTSPPSLAASLMILDDT